MNRYCLHLDIGLDYILKDPDYFSRLDVTEKKIAQWLIPQEALSNDFISWYESLGLDLWYRELFYTAPHENIFLHSDEINPSSCCKLNWVYDQGNTVMNWYEPNDGISLEWYQNPFVGGSYYSCEEGKYHYAHSDSIQKPSLVNVTALHDVKNNSDYPRWCVSIAFREVGAEQRLQWDRAVEIFKPYLK